MYFQTKEFFKNRNTYQLAVFISFAIHNLRTVPLHFLGSSFRQCLIFHCNFFRHVSSNDKMGKRYRETKFMFSIEDDDDEAGTSCMCLITKLFHASSALGRVAQLIISVIVNKVVYVAYLRTAKFSITLDCR